MVVVVRIGLWNGDKALIKAGRGHGGVGFGHRRADAAARWVDLKGRVGQTEGP